MDPFHHDLSSLFAQLGLDDSPAAIESFIRTHKPLPGEVKLDEAPFWTPAQACFLREKVKEDADWALTVDSLNVQLHEPVADLPTA